MKKQTFFFNETRICHKTRIPPNIVRNNIWQKTKLWNVTIYNSSSKLSTERPFSLPVLMSLTLSHISWISLRYSLCGFSGCCNVIIECFDSGGKCKHFSWYFQISMGLFHLLTIKLPQAQTLKVNLWFSCTFFLFLPEKVVSLYAKTR